MAPCSARYRPGLLRGAQICTEMAIYQITEQNIVNPYAELSTPKFGLLITDLSGCKGEWM